MLYAYAEVALYICAYCKEILCELLFRFTTQGILFVLNTMCLSNSYLTDSNKNKFFKIAYVIYMHILQFI